MAGTTRVPQAKACGECGEPFEARSPVQRFCSDKCRYRSRDRARGPKCRGCGKQMWGGRTSRPDGEARCRGCWRAELQHGVRMYEDRGCRCVDCRKAKAEATLRYLPPAYRHHWIASADRIAIYERDDWTCQLCGKPVDLTVHHLHRDAPSLDHIEPQSWALVPNHHPSNLRTAHRGCNSARGNRQEVTWAASTKPRPQAVA